MAGQNLVIDYITHNSQTSVIESTCATATGQLLIIDKILIAIGTFMTSQALQAFRNAPKIRVI